MESNCSNQSVQEKKFVPWNYGTQPSARARSLIEELNRQGRDEFQICGPSVEYRVFLFWIDIAYHIESDNGTLIKFAIEVDDEHHDNPFQKEKDRKKDQYLKSNGWIVRRIHHSEFDSKDVKDLAWEILFQVGIYKFQNDEKRHLS